METEIQLFVILPAIDPIARDRVEPEVSFLFLWCSAPKKRSWHVLKKLSSILKGHSFLFILLSYYSLESCLRAGMRGLGSRLLLSFPLSLSVLWLQGGGCSVLWMHFKNGSIFNRLFHVSLRGGHGGLRQLKPSLCSFPHGGCGQDILSPHQPGLRHSFTASSSSMSTKRHLRCTTCKYSINTRNLARRQPWLPLSLKTLPYAQR